MRAVRPIREDPVRFRWRFQASAHEAERSDGRQNADVGRRDEAAHAVHERQAQADRDSQPRARAEELVDVDLLGRARGQQDHADAEAAGAERRADVAEGAEVQVADGHRDEEQQETCDRDGEAGGHDDVEVPLPLLVARLLKTLEAFGDGDHKLLLTARVAVPAAPRAAALLDEVRLLDEQRVRGRGGAMGDGNLQRRSADGVRPGARSRELGPRRPIDAGTNARQWHRRRISESNGPFKAEVSGGPSCHVQV